VADPRRSHSGIDDVDYLIAATAIVTDAGLPTTNVPPLPDGRRAALPY
jgi:predicted nucleic acid-binding protein